MHPKLHRYLWEFYLRTPVGLVVLDADGVIVGANPGWTDMIGIPEARLLGQKLADCYWQPPEVEVRLPCSDHPVEVCFKRADGGVLYANTQTIVEHTAEHPYQLVYMVDITKQVEAQNNLALLEAVVINTEDAIVLLEAMPLEGQNHRRILFVNKAFTKLTGWPFEQIAGKTIAVLFGNDSDAGTVEATLDCERNRPTSRYEHAISTKSGREVWVEIISIPVYRDGQCTHWFQILRDITALRTYIAELIEQCNRAEQANRAKSEFLANMSHELRTPLNAVLGFAELIRNRNFGADVVRYQDYANDIYESGKHLLNIINDVLDSSKIEAGHYGIVEGVFPLDAVIAESCRVIATKADAKAITITQQNSEIVLFADRRAIKQVLINLLSNAIKFTPRNGRVEVQPSAADTIRIAVKDTGIGMSPEFLKHVGTKFQQAEPTMTKQYEGTGLGLSVAKSLVEMHGGKLSFTSKMNHGTTAIIELPLDRLRVP